MYPKFKEISLDTATWTVAFLGAIEERETKSKKPFCTFHLLDGDIAIIANLWNTEKKDIYKVQEKSVISVQLYKKLYNGVETYEVKEYQAAPDDAKLEDYLLTAPIPSQDMMDEIKSILSKEISETELYPLVMEILDENADKLLYWAAAKTIHHNCYAVMSYDKAVQIINFFMEHSRNKVIIGFYGGEPLLAFDLIKKIVQYIHSTFPERKVEYSITTNGTLLNNEIIEFFIREKFQMTLSIDGPKEIHDKNRHFQSGRGSFDVIVQKLTKLEQTFPKFFENVTTNTVINPEYNVNNYIDFFNDNVSLKNMHHRLSGLSDAGIDDIYVYNEDLKIAMAKEEIYAMANMLGWFAKDFELKEYFPPYMSDLIQKHAILESGEFISKSGHPGGPCIPGVKRCLVNIDGDIFPCEKAIENQEMVIGNTEQGFYLEKVKQFMNIGTLTENECKNCWAFLLCSSCGVSCTGSDGFCAKKRLKKCGGIQQYVIKILRSIKILEENGYDFYRFEKNVEE